jgi:hypothetical protein
MTEEAAPIMRPEELSPDEAEQDYYEELRRRIYDMRARGLSYRAIGKVVGLDPSTVRGHYRKARLEQVKEVEEKGWKLIAGGNLKRYKRAQETCLAHLAALEQGEFDENGNPRPGTSKKGSIQAAIWMQTLLRAYKQEEDYAFDLGLMPKASDKIDVTFKDARTMSLEELQNECAALEASLSRAKIVSDARAKELKRLPRTIEATATLVNVERPERVEKAAARIERLDSEGPENPK